MVEVEVEVEVRGAEEEEEVEGVVAADQKELVQVEEVAAEDPVGHPEHQEGQQRKYIQKSRQPSVETDKSPVEDPMLVVARFKAQALLEHMVEVATMEVELLPHILQALDHQQAYSHFCFQLLL